MLGDGLDKAEDTLYENANLTKLKKIGEHGKSISHLISHGKSVTLIVLLARATSESFPKVSHWLRCKVRFLRDPSEDTDTTGSVTDRCNLSR